MNKTKVNKIKRHTLLVLIIVSLYYAYKYFYGEGVGAVVELELWSGTSISSNPVLLGIPKISNFWNILFVPLVFGVFNFIKYKYFVKEDEEKISEENSGDLRATLIVGAILITLIQLFGIVGLIANMTIFVPLFTIVVGSTGRDPKKIQVRPQGEIRPCLKYVYIFLIGNISVCGLFYNFVVAIPISIAVVLVGLIIFGISYPIFSFVAFYADIAIAKTSKCIGNWYSGK